jgi:hypothetical protein
MTAPADRTAAARAVLIGNDRGGYTVPTAQLYPFQWNWDSAFVAMGFATFDAPRAWTEIETLLRGQWDDGMLPHIVFHAPSADYFPGPELWGTHHAPPTSGITQPPVLATAVRRILDTDPAGADRAAAIYPSLLRNHAWWAAARDPAATGLVATLHPWETGMDNSPAWDAPLARVPSETTTPVRRRDTAHVDAAMRPSDADYARYIHLVDAFRAVGWEPARMIAVSPFRVADVATNAILLRAEQDLLALADRFGTPAERAAVAARAERTCTALARLWNPDFGLYTGLDLTDGTPIAAATSAGFLPLFASVPDPTRTAALAATVGVWHRHLAWAVPSTDPADPRFEPRRYWRGPIWAVVNWMIAEGFAAAGETAVAADLHRQTARLIGEHGFAEYFDPTTGAGAGGGAFSWTAAIWLLLADAGYA